jgi:Kef-type K+ transport system membrane component KefB
MARHYSNMPCIVPVKLENVKLQDKDLLNISDRTFRKYFSSRILAAVLVLCMLGIVKKLRPILGAGDGLQAGIALGGLIIIAWVMGDIFRKIHLPRITGYVITGMILGPHLLDFISSESVKTLKFIDNIALALIGIRAGQEMKIALIRRRLKSILSISFSVLIITVGGTFLFIYFWGPRFLPFLKDIPEGMLIVAAIIIAYLEGAKSPVTTIAVLDETGAKGPLAEITLGAVIFKDLLMGILLGVVLSVCGYIAHPDLPHGILIHIFQFVILSLAIGFLMGLIVSASLTFSKKGSFILIFSLALAMSVISGAFHLEVLLVGGAAGFVIENYSKKSEHFLEGLEQGTPFIYLLFFPVNAASLDISLIGGLWKAAVIILILRTVLVFCGVWVGSRLVEDFPSMRRYGWMGFMNQESVTMALALILAAEFPELGEPLKAFILVMIVITDLYAPAMFKYALYKSGEAKS